MTMARALVPLVLAAFLVPNAGAQRLSPTATDTLATVNGISLAYRISGRANGRPILLIAGTGMQLIEWPPELIDGLTRRGYRVIVFDNRDAGRSTHFTGVPDWTAILTAMATGKPPTLIYSAGDMATDALGLLDRLNITQADIVGVSGGAAIAELIAIGHPGRVHSLTLLLANAGDPKVPFPANPARIATIPPPPMTETAAEQVERRIKTFAALAGSLYPIDIKLARAVATAAAARNTDPQGAARQGAAQIALGDLRARLAAITVPTVVIHGSDDPLIASASGRQVAAAIRGARFLLIEGMGHDLPAPVVPRILDAIGSVARWH